VIDSSSYYCTKDEKELVEQMNEALANPAARSFNERVGRHANQHLEGTSKRIAIFSTTQWII
jgi:hypothetical protein